MLCPDLASYFGQCLVVQSLLVHTLVTVTFWFIKYAVDILVSCIAAINIQCNLPLPVVFRLYLNHSYSYMLSFITLQNGNILIT